MDKKEKQLLHICSYYVGTRLYQNLFDSLEKTGISEDIYVFKHKEQNVQVQAPNVILSECYNKWERCIFRLKHHRVLSDLRKRLKLNQYSVIHAHSLFSNGYIAYRLHRELDIPYIVAVRNTDVNVFFKKMVHLRRLGVKILYNASNVIFLSEAYKLYTLEQFVPKQYQSKIEGKSVVIPNGIDEFWLENKFLSRKPPHGTSVNIIYAGMINSNKNIETTIKACELLLQEGYEVSFRVVGRIADNRYHQLIANVPFLEYVEHCDKEALIDYYREADIFVMPSKHETFGLVYAEAMSQGLPVIYTRGQGFDGHFSEGVVGFSVPYNSSEAIVRSVRKILSNYQTMSDNCITYSSKFDWDVIAKEYARLYAKSIEME